MFRENSEEVLILLKEFLQNNFGKKFYKFFYFMRTINSQRDFTRLWNFLEDGLNWRYVQRSITKSLQH